MTTSAHPSPLSHLLYPIPTYRLYTLAPIADPHPRPISKHKYNLPTSVTPKIRCAGAARQDGNTDKRGGGRSTPLPKATGHGVCFCRAVLGDGDLDIRKWKKGGEKMEEKRLDYCLCLRKTKKRPCRRGMLYRYLAM